MHSHVEVEDKSPWLPLLEQEPPKDALFWAWDNQLSRIVKNMRWYEEDIQDWGSESDNWSGDFAFWMYPVEDIDAIASPYRYETQ